jgi:PAS domain S-box-containing protein
MVSMTVIYFLPLPSYLHTALLDGAIMIALILPWLYFLQIKPILRQVGERTLAEQALRKNEYLLKKMLDLLPVGVWITNEKGEIVHGNPATLHIWGGARYVGVDGYRAYTAFWPNTKKKLEPHDWAAYRAVMKGETSLNEEVEIVNFNGQRKVILNSAVPILSEDQQIEGAIVVNQDITERRQFELDLIQTNELLEKFFLSVHTLIAYLDKNFNFIRVNEEYARHGGHAPENFIGKNHFDLYPHPENHAIFQKVIDTGAPFYAYDKPFEYEEFPERGVTYWDWALHPVKGARGEIQGLVLSLVDVTERVIVQKQLTRQNQDLLELSQAEKKQRQLAENLAQTALALASYNDRLYKAESAARKAAETMSSIARELGQKLDLNHVLTTLLDHIYEIIHTDTARVLLLTGEFTVALEMVRGYGEWEGKVEIPSLPEGLSIEALVEELRQTRTSRTVVHPAFLFLQPGESCTQKVCYWLLVPIFTAEKLIGLVELGAGEPGAFSEEHTRWMEGLVSQAGVAIQNAWLFEQVRDSQERLQLLARKLVEVQENERRYIARELHDEAGQVLSTLKLRLLRLGQSDSIPRELSASLVELAAITDHVLEDLHRLAIDLRPAVLDHIGLVAALEQLAANLQTRILTIRLKAIGFEQRRLPPAAETAIYRIVQEALTNASRYSQATSIGILLERCDGKVRVFVEDNGVGFDPQRVDVRNRLGLVGIRERAEMLGGSLTIESSPNAGTSIIVEIPDEDPHFDRR